MKAPVRISKPNGYNEDYRRECGHEYRINVEFFSLDRKALTVLRREAAKRPCRGCADTKTTN